VSDISASKLRLALSEARHQRLLGIEEATKSIIKSQEEAMLASLKEALPSPQELYDFADRIDLKRLKEIDSVEEATELMVSLRAAIMRWGGSIESFFKHRKQ